MSQELYKKAVYMKEGGSYPVGTEGWVTEHSINAYRSGPKLYAFEPETGHGRPVGYGESVGVYSGDFQVVEEAEKE